MARLRLFSMHRNSAGWRVRIALGLKGIPYEYVAVPQLAPGEYLRLNPQGLMPALEIDGEIVAQSGAIMELLEELWPEPSLFPADPLVRARARAFGQLIACDLHPINNTRIRKYLAGPMRQPEPRVAEWVRHWSAVALASLEASLQHGARASRFAFGSEPGFAELHLVPQLYNCRRFGCDLSAYPRLLSIEAECRGIAAFKAAAPEQMPDYGGAEPAWMQ